MKSIPSSHTLVLSGNDFKGIALVSVCMNRNKFLLKSVPEWMKLNIPVILVDWSSAEPLRHTLRSYLDHITIVEVPNKQHFDLSRSKNLSYRAARFLYPHISYLLSLDGDVYPTHPEKFLSAYPLLPRTFYTGGIRISAKEMALLTSAEPEVHKVQLRNQLGTYGSFLCPLSLLEQVNMNDERMSGYGVFDIDLYTRLRNAGATHKYIRINDLIHQPHEDRSANYAAQDVMGDIERNDRIRHILPEWNCSITQEIHTVVINGCVISI